MFYILPYLGFPIGAKALPILSPQILSLCDYVSPFLPELFSIPYFHSN